VLTRTVRAKEANERVKAGSYTWAYRTVPLTAEKAAEGRPAVLFLHGIGSGSFGFRNVLGIFAEAGFPTYAPDWLGCGDSDKPADFAYDERSYLKELSNFIKAVGLDKKPFVLVTQGFILGQYALRWALENADSVDKLIVLNTPLTAKAKLPQQLAAYKGSFPFFGKPKGAFDAIQWNAGGSAYVMVSVHMCLLLISCAMLALSYRLHRVRL
jgi:pimeloyl-ACP methyl ester carboxylesterase